MKVSVRRWIVSGQNPAALEWQQWNGSSGMCGIAVTVESDRIGTVELLEL